MAVMMTNLLKGILTGAVVGAVGGPLIAGLSGSALLGLIWLASGQADQLPWVAVFGLIIAPFGASVGVIVGSIIGGVRRWFGSLLNAGSFGGLVGGIIGLLVLPFLFDGRQEEFSSGTAAVIALILAGLATALAVKFIQRRLAQSEST